MKKKIWLFVNISIICMCVCAIVFYVYSAKNANTNVNGSIGFTAHDCKVSVSAELTGALEYDSESQDYISVIKYFNSTNTYNGSPIIINGDVSWSIGSLIFDDYKNISAQKPVNDIVLKVTVTNESDYYVDVNINKKFIGTANSEIFMYVPNCEETLSPASAKESAYESAFNVYKTKEFIIKFKLKRDGTTANNNYPSKSINLNLSYYSTYYNLFTFSKSEQPSYLAKDWQSQIQNGFGITEEELKQTTKISFLKDLANETLSGFEKNLDGTLKNVLVGAKDASDFTSTDISNVKAYYKADTKEIVIYSKPRLYAPVFCSNMFRNWSYLTNCVFDNFDTSLTIEMDYMFAGDYNPENLDATETNIFMELEDLDCVYNFDTSNVRTMKAMFQDCIKIRNINYLSHFNFEKVMYLSYMFYRCSNLSWNFSSGADPVCFNTSKLLETRFMFSETYSIYMVDVSEMDVSNVDDFTSMFSFCKAIRIYSNVNWKIKADATTTRMFLRCTSITGSKGTKYDENKIDGTYARVDGGVILPGYFYKRDVVV